MRSVVLASCEGAAYIGAQLRSILDQIERDDEIIVCDDASSDDTLAIVAALQDPRVVIIRNASRVGYVKNFERAVSAVRGDNIFFSDQDDIWLPQKVSLITHALGRKACVVSDAVVVDAQLRPIYDSYFKFRKASTFSFLRTFFRPRFIGATMACRKEFLDRLLPFPHNVPHDFWISLNAISTGDLEVIREPLILYRRHSATASTSATLTKRPLGTILKERLAAAVWLIAHRFKAN